MGLAIAGLGIAAVGTAATITSSAMQADAAKKAAGAGAGAGKKFVKQQTQDVAKYDAELQSALSTYNANITGISSAISNIDPKIKIPDFSLLGTPDVYKTNKKGEIIYDKKTGLPKIKNPGKASAVLESIKAANLVTENSLYQIETVLPGAADARAKAMESLANWEQKLEQQYDQVQKAYPMLEKAEAGFGVAGEQYQRAAQRYEQAGQLLQEQLPQIAEARKVAGEYLLGDLPDVTKKQITRAIAEAGGAGYNPAAASRTSGFQIPQGMLSQNLAQAAEERQRFGLGAVGDITQQTAAMSAGQAGIAGGQSNIAQGQASIAQGLQGVGMAYGQAGAASANIGEAFRGMQGTNMAWQNLSQGFLQNVPQMMGLALTGRGQDIDKKQFEIQAALNQQNMLANLATGQFNAATNVAGNIYDARSGLTQSRYGVAQSNIQNNLAAQQANAQMVSDIGQGIGQLGTAGMAAYNQYATAAGASTTPMDSGFYKGQIGAANAYGVAPSQVRQYGSQGWSLG
jgi:hypothetical protein